MLHEKKTNADRKTNKCRDNSMDGYRMCLYNCKIKLLHADIISLHLYSTVFKSHILNIHSSIDRCFLMYLKKKLFCDLFLTTLSN